MTAILLRLRRVLARVLPRRVGPVLGVERDDLYRGRRKHGEVEVVRVHPLVVLDAPVSSHESCSVGVSPLTITDYKTCTYQRALRISFTLRLS